MDKAVQYYVSLRDAQTFQGELLEENYIGRGSCGDVYLFEDSRGRFAVKRIHLKRNIQDYRTLDYAMEDVKLLGNLKHENIVKFYSIEVSQWYIHQYFEYMAGKSLRDFLDELAKQSKVLPETLIKSFTIQVLRGLDYLHCNKIVHRDIKPQNLLLDKDRQLIKLADFHLSKILAMSRVSSAARGSLQYMAPEVLRKEKYNLKSDVWSVGATMVEMITGKPPFPDCKTVQTLQARISECGKLNSNKKPQYSLQARGDLSQEVALFLDMIFMPPSLRLSPAGLLSLDYLKCDNNQLKKAPEMQDQNVLEYALNTNPKGLHLVISNEKYVQSGTRFGTEADVSRLTEVFENIGFPTTVKRDLKGDEIVASIDEFLKQAALRKCSCVVLSILAHGEKEGVKGVDETVVTFLDILHALSAAKAPVSLACKPKLLIVQACRGGTVERPAVLKADQIDKDAGNLGNKSAEVVPNDDGEVSEKGELRRAFRIGLDARRTSNAGFGDFDDDSDDEEASLTQYANAKADIVVAYSTSRGNASVRHTKLGAFFIQQLCKVLERHWRVMHVLDLLTKAIQDVMLAVSDATGWTFTQTPEIKSTLRKMFFLSNTNERQVLAAAFAVAVAVAERGTVAPAAATKQPTATATAASPVTQQPAAAQSAASNTSVMLIGGSGDKRKASLFSEAEGGLRWTVASTLNDRFYSAAALWNGKVVVCGGWLVNQAITNTVEQYEPQSNSWQALCNLLHARSCHALVNVNGKLLAIGGDNHKKILSSVELLDQKRVKWKSVAPLTTARQGLACAAYKTFVLATGGYSGLDTLSSCEVYDIEKNSWTPCDSMKVTREYHTLASYKNSVFVFGGRFGKHHSVHDVEQFDWASKTWTTTKYSLKLARFELAACIVQSRIYVMGGCCDADQTPLDTVECLDLQSKQISTVAALPEPKRAFAAVSVDHFNVPKKPVQNNSENKQASQQKLQREISENSVAKTVLVCVGGTGPNNNGSKVSVYDVSGNTWRSAAQTSQLHVYGAAVTWNNSVVVAGGCDAQLSASSAAEKFDALSNSWRPFPSLLEARDSHALVNADGKIYAIGGCKERKCLNTVERFDANEERWTRVEPLKIAREHLAAAKCQRGIVVTGGQDSKKCLLSSCELYDTAKQAWFPIAPLNAARSLHAAAGHNQTVFVFGGSARQKSRADVEQYDVVANRWTMLETRLTVARFELTAASTEDGRVYLVAGCDWQDAPDDRTELDTVDVFEPESMQCSSVSQLPEACRAHAASFVSVSDEAYKRLTGRRMSIKLQ